jgi:hypothetical protein
MRTVNLTIIICLITFQGYAQYSLAHPTSESSYLHEFYSTETLVPIVGIDSIDAKIKKTLEDYWTFTKLKFVPLDELDEIQYVSRINLFTHIMYAAGSDPSTGLGATSLSLYIPADIQVTGMRNVIASVPIQCTFPFDDEFSIECGYEQIGYKIDILLIQLIEVVKFVNSEEYRPMLADFSGMVKYVEKYNKAVIKKHEKTQIKPLLMNENFFNEKLDSASFKRFYRNEIKIVDDHQYEEILNSDNNKYLVMLRGNNPSSVFSIFDLETRKTLYIGIYLGKLPFIRFPKYCQLNKKQIIHLNKHMKRLAP